MPPELPAPVPPADDAAPRPEGGAAPAAVPAPETPPAGEAVPRPETDAPPAAASPSPVLETPAADEGAPAGDADPQAPEAPGLEEGLRLAEAILFSSPEPVKASALARALPDGVQVAEVIEALRGRYEGRGVELVRAGEAWAFRTAPDLAERLAVVRKKRRKLSRAALETLAIVAYHQPVTRAEIEEIRGVAVSPGTLDILFEEGWIEPKGRKQVPGRPSVWRTTTAFLDHFGLESRKDLPGLRDLQKAGLLSATLPPPDPAAPGEGEAAGNGNGDASEAKGEEEGGEEGEEDATPEGTRS